MLKLEFICDACGKVIASYKSDHNDTKAIQDTLAYYIGKANYSTCVFPSLPSDVVPLEVVVSSFNKKICSDCIVRLATERLKKR